MNLTPVSVRANRGLVEETVEEEDVVQIIGISCRCHYLFNEQHSRTPESRKAGKLQEQYVKLIRRKREQMLLVEVFFLIQSV